MGFSEKVVLFESVNVGHDAVTNNTPKIEAEINIKLDKDQDYEFARIFAQVCIPNAALGYAFSISFNGRNLGNRQFGPFESGCKTLDIPVSDLMENGKNKLTFHLDGRLQPLDVQLYADLFYELNTFEPPKSVEVSEPSEKGLQDLIVKVAIVGGVVVVGAVVLSAVLKRALMPARMITG